MRTTLTTAATAGLLLGGLAAATPAAAALDPGPVELLLNDCTPKQTNDLIPGCSYLGLKEAKQGGKYVYLNADWRDGTYDSAGALKFPAASQKWPTVTTALFGVKATVKPTGDITGTLDPSGKLDLTMPYEVDLTGGPTNLDCRLSGTAQLTTAGTDPFNNQAGAAFDQATGAFATVTTPASKVTFSDAGACSAVTTFLDPNILTNGITFYLAGTLFDQTGDAVASDKKQTADVDLPKTIDPKGTTKLLGRPQFTDVGQEIDVEVTWRPKGGTYGKKSKYAKLKTTKEGKILITPKGETPKLTVKMQLTAGAVDGYTDYKRTKKWTVKTDKK
jgi:hypothetical protein